MNGAAFGTGLKYRFPVYLYKLVIPDYLFEHFLFVAGRIRCYFLPLLDNLFIKHREVFVNREEFKIVIAVKQLSATNVGQVISWNIFPRSISL